jgi:hypothetical protein
MMSIYDKIRNDTMNMLQKEAAEDPMPEIKGFTVRLPADYIVAADRLAEALGTNRQALVSSLLTESLTEAIQGYASVFTSPREVVQQLLAGTDLVYQAVLDAKDSKQGGNE